MANDPTDNLNEQSNENNIKTSKPPPIFIQTQINYNTFCLKINELTDSSGFDCKYTKGIKPQTYSPDSYRSVVNYLKANNVLFHSHQLKEEKAFHIVVRNLHPTTDLFFIKDQLLENGHIIRNVRPQIDKGPPFYLFYRH